MSDEDSLQAISNIPVVSDAVHLLNDYGISMNDYNELSKAWFEEREGWLCFDE